LDCRRHSDIQAPKLIDRVTVEITFIFKRLLSLRGIRGIRDLSDHDGLSF